MGKTVELPNLHYEGDDLFTAPGSYFHFTEPFPELFPGLSGLHCAYDIPPVTISDCIMTVGLHMTRERRGRRKSDERMGCYGGNCIVWIWVCSNMASQ